MGPVFEGVVARRLLVSYRLDPAAAAALLPAPLEPLLQRGWAVGGVSFIRLEQIRPRGLPAFAGLSSENVAHRLAVTAPGEGGGRVPGVFVLRRDTESRLVAAVGRPLFASEHRRARIEVEEDPRRLRIEVKSEDGGADALVRCEWGATFRPTGLFPTLEEAARLFRECDRGYRGGAKPMIQLGRLPWRAEAVELQEARSAFFDDPTRFPAGAAVLDGAVAMRPTPTQWVTVRELPEILEEPLPSPA